MANTGPRNVRNVFPHPNEMDCKRIERLLSHRSRYRYVKPEVSPVKDGYRIQCPCCSRNIDRSGGVIDIALLEYDIRRRVWRLHNKDHAQGQWLMYGEYKTLSETLQQLNQDSKRVFWQ